jgi:hypothetical protein
METVTISTGDETPFTITKKPIKIKAFVAKRPYFKQPAAVSVSSGDEYGTVYTQSSDLIGKGQKNPPEFYSYSYTSSKRKPSLEPIILEMMSKYCET